MPITLLNKLKHKKKRFRRITKNAIFIILGVLSASFGLKSFLLPNHFLDGGVTGMSLLATAKTGIDLSILIIAINVPFIIMGYKQISPLFALKTLIAIAALAVCVHYVDFPIITSDKLLIAFFGGLFLGGGIGLSIRGGSVLDGTEVLALYVSKKTSLTVGDVILVFNILIFAVAAVLINIETALYAILTYLSASKTIDFIVNGIEEYMGVTIVSEFSDDIREAIVHHLGRGVTVYKGERGFRKPGMPNEIDIVYTIVTRLELTKLQNEIDRIDPNAFFFQQSINDLKGGVIKKRPLH